MTDELEKEKVKLPLLHFAHMSEKQPGMMGLTPDDDLESYRQVHMKMGKYIKLIAPELEQPKVAHIANVFNLYCKEHLYSFDIARTAEDIVKVYQNGPNSCMAHELSYYSSSPFYPVEVYESPDVGVAYIEDKVKDRYVARAVLDMVGKKYAVIYGNAEALRPELEALGCEQDSDGIYGCRLKKLLSSSGNDVMPYIDGNRGVTSFSDDDGEWWLVEYNGDYTAGNEGGTLQTGIRCQHCDDEMNSEDDTFYSEYHDRQIGRCCIDSYRYAYTGRHGQDWIEEDGSVWYHNGEYYTPDALPYHDLALTDDGEVYPDDEVVQLDSGVYHLDCCISYVDSSGDTQWLHSDDSDKLVEDFFSSELIYKPDAFEAVDPEDGETVYSYTAFVEVDGELQAAA
mgnify:FL=1